MHILWFADSRLKTLKGKLEATFFQVTLIKDYPQFNMSMLREVRDILTSRRLLKTEELNKVVPCGNITKGKNDQI